MENGKVKLVLLLCGHLHIIKIDRKTTHERLTIKSQALKWYFWIKYRNVFLDIFGTQLVFIEPWKLHGKKSIVTGAQKEYWIRKI